MTNPIEIEGVTVEVDNTGMVLDPCGRCASNGDIQAFRHIQGGVCFDCGGTGGNWMTHDEATRRFRRRRKDRERRAAKRQAKNAERDAAAAAFATAHPELAALLADLLEEGGPQRHGAHPILVDMAERFVQYRTLSDKQVELAEKLRTQAAERVAQRDAERDAAEDAPTGRNIVTGLVVKVASKPNPHSYYGELVWRMTVKDDRGFLVNTTIPAALRDAIADEGAGADGLSGRRVRFTAGLEHGDDAKFAFGKRPSKAELFVAEESVAA